MNGLPAAAGMGEAADDFVLRGDHITLDALLKATGLAPSGGAAKAMIADGGVTVDGAVERRRGCKLRAGARVQVADQTVRLTAPDALGD